MIKQTILASDFEKKSYAKPQMKAHHVKPSSIIATSGPAKSTQNEEYETGNTDDWFN